MYTYILKPRAILMKFSPHERSVAEISADEFIAIGNARALCAARSSYRHYTAPVDSFFVIEFCLILKPPETLLLFLSFSSQGLTGPRIINIAARERETERVLSLVLRELKPVVFVRV